MANSVTDQQRFLIQWFRTWSEYQREDFTQIIAHKLNPSHFINGLLANEIQNISTNSDIASGLGRKPSLFTCQMKLFNEWWDSWKSEERDGFTASLKESDPKFWVDVEDELSGSRKKDDEEFFTTIVNNYTSTTETVGQSENENGQVTKEEATKLTDNPQSISQNQDAGEASETSHVNGTQSAENGTTAESVPNEEPKCKEQERVLINGSGDGVLVIEEDNDEII